MGVRPVGHGLLFFIKTLVNLLARVISRTLGQSAAWPLASNVVAGVGDNCRNARPLVLH